MSWLTTKLISAFLLPPFNFLLLGIVGLALSAKKLVLGRRFVALALALLWVFAMPVTGDALLGTLECVAALPAGAAANAQAIVVLGGGTNLDAPEYGGDTVGTMTLERLRYAAILQRQTGLPVLVTGGDPLGRGVSEAALMARMLADELKVPVRWQETESYNTRQNADYSRRVLQKAGVHDILLVTQGWHMPRARFLFERAGFEVLPAGTGFHSPGRLTSLDFLPNASALENSSLFFHEVIGLLWVRLSGWT